MKYTELAPPPDLCDLPPKFTSWRVGQAKALTLAFDSEKQVSVLALPTGVGKSAVGVALANLLSQTSGRWIYLVSTKGQQDQVSADFADHCGAVDIRGMANYPCRALISERGRPPLFQREAYLHRARYPGETPTCDHGPCLEGSRCHFGAIGCDFFDQFRRAKQAKRLISNYSFYFARREELGAFDTIICDEAHELLEQLCRYQSIEISEWEVRNARAGQSWPRHTTSLHEWQIMAIKMHLVITEKLKLCGPGAMKKLLSDLGERCQRLAGISDPAEWVVTQDHLRATIEPKWPRKEASRLFGASPRVILMSATITKKLVDTLAGGGGLDYDWIETSSPFPVERRPVYQVKSASMSYRNRGVGVGKWVEVADALIGARLDRKGIFHSQSYDRAQLFVDRTSHRDICIIHDSRTRAAAVERFRNAEAPALLVSPSIGTGYDFPHDLCRYQIVGKLPYPDTRAPIVAARKADDSTWLAFLTSVALIQMTGRPMRAADDWCETFLLDDDLRWFVNRNQPLFPKWWLRAWRAALRLPKPLVFE